MAKIEPFEQHAQQYEDWFEKNRFAYESELKAVKTLLPEGGNGMEIGVGSGRFAAPLGIKTDIEPSAKMREIARKRGIDAVDGVAEALPFDDARFDFLLMVTTICFLNDIEAALKEAHRVLRPDGCLIIGFIDKDSRLGRLYQMSKEKSVFYREATFYSVNELVVLLRRAGFGKFRFTQTIFHQPAEMKGIEAVRDGYGEGSFVAIKAGK